MFKCLSSVIILLLISSQALAAKTVFTDGNPATRTPGTRVTAAYLNAVNNHRHDGQNADGSGVLDYAVASGSANAITITLAPALTAHVSGLPIIFKVSTSNTDATTIAINGLTAIPIVHRDGSALIANDLLVGQLVGIAYNGTAYQLTQYESQLVTNALTLQGQSAAQLVPPGAILAFAMPTIPSGWLIADGRAVSRTQYAALYAAIGTTWGSGDNSTTFNLPNFQGEFLRGWDNGRGIDSGRQIGSFQSGFGGGLGEVTMATSQTFTTPVTVPIDGTYSGWILTGYGGSTEYGLKFKNSTADVRPRNLAVLYCIKY